MYKGNHGLNRKVLIPLADHVIAQHFSDINYED